MKVSVNWLKELVSFELPGADELAKRIGSQLGEVEETKDIGAKYAGVVIVKVVECSPLENTDHLNLCFVDDAGVTPHVTRREDGLVQVVCGAPNVKAGVMVAWLPPGATVPSTYDADPFTLEARELRGAVSNGMLASAKELAIGDSHEGLLLLEDTAKPGASFAETYGLNDVIIDIENKMFTHRPDCFGQLGVAREVAGIMGQQFTSPDWYTQSIIADAPLADNGRLKVTNEIPELCPRYMLVAIDTVVVAPSPVWLQTYLSRVGIRPVNNIVDMTNYIMLLTGQPLHAFDYDKVAVNDQVEIVVRNPRQDEQMTLLDGKTLQPRAEAILIATPEKPIALGGVMGGGNSEIDQNTTRILIECANFDMYNIRRTSMQHGIFTDAVTRYNKGQSEWQCAPVLAKAIELVQQLCGDAKVMDHIVDNHTERRKNVHVSVTTKFLNSRLGLDLSANQMSTLLANVEFEVAIDGDTLNVMAPFWRTDIEQPEDIVEEVGRLYGFDQLPLVLPRRDITPAVQDPLLQLKTRIRNSLARAGANEVLSYSFVHGNLLDKVTQKREQAFTISNALSPDLQYYRLNALPSLLDKVHGNIKAGYDEFALFELNKGHNLMHKDDAEGGVPTEIEFLDFVYASKTPKDGAAFYTARKYLDTLAADLGLTLTYAPITEDPHVPASDPYDYTRSAFVSVAEDGQFLGMVGELKASVIKALKLPKHTAVFTVGPQQLLMSTSKAQNRYQPLPRFPKIEQDVCYKVANTVSYATLADLVHKTLNDKKPAQTRLTIAPLDIYKRQDDADHQQITFRIGLASYQKTMTDTEMSELLTAVTETVSAELQAERM